MYWFSACAVYIFGLLILIRARKTPAAKNYRSASNLFGVFVLLFIPKLILALTSLLLLILVYFPIFLQNILSYGGFGLSVFVFFAIFHGLIWGKFKYTVHKVVLESSSIPKEFHNYRIVQLSDMHIGSFNKDYAKVLPGIEKVNNLKPDLILFTGDLVNNLASETDGWEETLKSLKAKDGIFAILGNHDYGDYYRFNNSAEKKKNIDDLIHFQEKIGFTLLLNQNTKISRENASINIIGVENWGKPPFPQYGNLKKALAGVDTKNFTILMSHDPSHWKQEVAQKTKIHLTLSGHTHGMQFGFEFGKIKWSPVKFKYPEWAGLYTLNQQLLYVNRGFGFIGFPGRVGIWPEITSIELRHKSL